MDYLTKKQKDRSVVPNWRFFSETLEIGELESNRIGKPAGSLYAIDDYVDSWLGKKSFSTAGDLISAAIANGQSDNRFAKEAAQYVTENNSSVFPVLERSAKFILSSNDNKYNVIHSQPHIELIQKLSKAQDMGLRIHDIRHKMNIYPYNAVLYVDMARAQLTVGNKDKAIRLMQVALQLEPNNRFIVRAAVRLFNHIGDFDRANSALRGSSLIKHDPWLIAADIAIGMKRGRNSVHIKNGMNIIESRNYHPFSYSELASSLGTLEYYYGTRKKSRKFFNTSIISPNDNSLAQAEWVAPLLQLEFERKTNVKLDYEARFYQTYFKKDYELAMKELVDWIIDIPYSQKPIYLGTNISLTFLRNFDLAEAILKIGLKVSPNNLDFVNNMAYTLARKDKTKEAQEYMDLFLKAKDSDVTESGKVCQKATQGLIFYRKGEIEKGRALYDEAVAEAKKLKSTLPEVYYKAIINSKREELISSGFEKTECLEELSNLDIPEHDRELKTLIEEVKMLYQEHQIQVTDNK